MKPSTDIFDAYAKIALAQGLISNQPQVKTAEEESNPRYDSHDMTAIELLYGVKPNGKDEKSLIEQAHPTSYIVGPTHDKLNGLVENQQELQNVMVGIATKPNSGTIGRAGYVMAAKEQLINELIKVSFLLDRNNEISLMTLSDELAAQLTKEAHPLLIPALVAAVGAIVGYGLYKGNHPDSEGFYPDLKKAISEIKDAVDAPGQADHWWDTEDYKELMPAISPLLANMEQLQSAYEEYDAKRIEISKTLMEVSSESDPATQRKALKANGKILLEDRKMDELTKLMDNVSAAGRAVLATIPEAVEQFSTAEERYKTYSSFWSALVKVKQFFAQSDVEDAADSLEVLASSIPMMLSDVVKTKGKLGRLKSLYEKSKSEELSFEGLEDSSENPEGVHEQPKLTPEQERFQKSLPKFV